ncbi:hypothetical protein P9209_10975 [Prescottella defluvii]|nr:hypothetical protein P9209_10975 [Prescottella defluvii]
MASASLPWGRSRLLTRLDEAPQTVLWGPRGYGKTTLVETWLAAQPDSTVIRVEVPDPRTATEQYWSALTERVNADTDVLVLDRPDRLCDMTIWERLHTIRAAHRGLRVVVSIRESTLLESVRLPDPNLTVVTAAELEFTEAEVAGLLAHHAVSSPERTARDLWRTTGGHPALVAIAEDVVRAFGSDLDFERERAYLAVRVQIDRYVEDMLLEDPGIGDMARTIAVLRRPSPMRWNCWGSTTSQVPSEASNAPACCDVCQRHRTHTGRGPQRSADPYCGSWSGTLWRPLAWPRRPSHAGSPTAASLSRHSVTRPTVRTGIC